MHFLGPGLSSSVVMRCILLVLYVRPDVLGPPQAVIAGLSQAGGGGLGGGSLPPIFGRKVNPISTRGADYAHHSKVFVTLSADPV